MNKDTKKGIELIRQALWESAALAKTHKFINSYILRAKQSLESCQGSEYLCSLKKLADFINEGSGIRS